MRTAGQARLQDLKRPIKQVLARTRTLPIAMGLYSRLRRIQPQMAMSNQALRRNGAPDGLPLPPTRLVELVAGTPNLAWFLEGGALAAGCVRNSLAAESVQIERLDAILDFGCGCGRVARHWSALRPGTVHGVDYNPELIEWARQNLPFGSFTLNRPWPPLDAEGATFDVVYAFSVFTHMPEDMQAAWMSELVRILKPGGHLIFSTHGAGYKHHLSPRERAAFDAGEMIVKPGGAAGTNVYQAYHSRMYVENNLCAGLTASAFTPAGALGNPVQDLHVFQRPG